ncbi:MAG: transcription elongation factor GreAB [Kofleriaceae bacterium]
MQKRELKAALLARLEIDLAAARAAHAAAMEGATHAEARPENDKDTRGLEQSYLARGHAQRVAELEAALVHVAVWQPRAFVATEPVSIGALIDLQEAGRTRRFLLATHGGGLTLGDDVTVLTPTSPIGRAVLGRSLDDEVELGARILTITRLG